MRVIAGRLKGRRLEAPEGAQVRPTADRVKEALFSILGPQLGGARVLDLYAGTGSLGIEALSRGAAAVTFVEHHLPALHALRRNLRSCGVLDRSEVQACRVETFLERPGDWRGPYQILLADPPYQLLGEVEAWAGRIPDGLLSSDGVAALEHAQKMSPPLQIGSLGLVRTYTYGDTALSIYRAIAPKATA